MTALLHQDQKQVISQRIDPKIILANGILQLTSLELQQSIENEMLENPALEAMEEPGCAGDCLDPNTCPVCSARRVRETHEANSSEEIDLADTEAEYEALLDGVFREVDEDFDLVGNIEADMTLQEHLRGLLRAAVPTVDYFIGEYLIENLDERGWLSGDLEIHALELNVPLEKAEEMLLVIQGFDPPGVGARNIQECLLLQLAYLRDEAEPTTLCRRIALAEKLVRDLFEHVVARRHTRLARAAGVSVDEVKKTLEFIGAQLNPSPASAFRPPWAYRPNNSKAVIRPDVVIRRTELGYEVEVLGGEPFSLGINPAYRELYNQIKTGQGHHTEETRKYVTEHVERAELFIRNLSQRRHTLRQITRCIIECQMGFVETGSRQFLRALTRTQVARMLDMHESTVSRATANKFVQMPNQEVVAFNVFFNSSLSVKDQIEQIIQTEDPASPLSDQQIVEKLEERGIHVARRTVVKYRESQKILSSTRRRR